MAHEVVHPLEEEVRLAALRPVDGLALPCLECLEPRAIGRDLVRVEHVDGEEIAFLAVLVDRGAVQPLRHGNSLVSPPGVSLPQASARDGRTPWKARCGERGAGRMPRQRRPPSRRAAG